MEKFGTEVLRDRDEWGYTPAHWAALDGNVEIMRYIVDRGAPVDLPCLGTQGPRPIHWACRKGHAAVVQVLLQAGVAVNAADFKGLTPLMTACMFGRTATAAYLLGVFPISVTPKGGFIVFDIFRYGGVESSAGHQRRHGDALGGLQRARRLDKTAYVLRSQPTET